jgi:hypothetical protein
LLGRYFSFKSDCILCEEEEIEGVFSKQDKIQENNDKRKEIIVKK